MSLSLNQFKLEPVVGMLTEEPNFNVFSCELATDGEEVNMAGQAVAFSHESGDQIIVTRQDTHFKGDYLGFVAYDTRRNMRGHGDLLRVASYGSVIYLYSLASFNRGDYLKWSDIKNAEGNTGVQKYNIGGGDLNTRIGRALDNATGDNQLVRVYVQTPKSAARNA
jgi:hypothetical protein